MISEAPKSVLEMIRRNDSTYLDYAAGWPHESVRQLLCRIGVSLLLHLFIRGSSHPS